MKPLTSQEIALKYAEKKKECQDLQKVLAEQKKQIKALTEALQAQYDTLGIKKKQYRAYQRLARQQWVMYYLEGE